MKPYIKYFILFLLLNPSIGLTNEQMVDTFPNINICDTLPFHKKHIEGSKFSYFMDLFVEISQKKDIKSIKGNKLIEKLGFQGVILSENCAIKIILQDKRKEYPVYRKLSKREIINLEKNFKKSCFQVDSSKIDSLSDYRRQYIGVKNCKGEKLIYINFIYKPSDDNWKKFGYSFSDFGGFYTFVYYVENKKLSRYISEIHAPKG